MKLKKGGMDNCKGLFRSLQVNLNEREGIFYVVGNFGSYHSYDEYVVGKSCYNQNVVISVMVRLFGGFGDG